MRLQTVACAAALLVLLTVGMDAQAPHPPVVDLATAYVHRFFDAFSNVVAEEVYTQEITSPRRKRTLRSDFLMVRYPGAEQWHGFRDVFEVDGKSVRTEQDQERLTRLFLEPAENALRRAEDIARAGSRYNIMDVGTLNHPFRVLAFLQVEYRDRFRYTLAGMERSLGPNIRTVRFEEFQRPTVLRQGANSDLPTHGLVWVEEQTGRVVKTELRIGMVTAGRGAFNAPNAFPITITTVFKFDEQLGIDVPLEMRDWYPRGSGEMRGLATYGRFRRFQVRAEEAIDAAPTPR